MTPSCHRLALVLFCVASYQAAAAEARSAPAIPNRTAARSWTTVEGRVFPATMVSVQGAQIILRLPTGQLATFPLARLSAADRAFIEGGQPPPVAAPTVPAEPAQAAKAAAIPPPERRTWPTKVEVDSRTLEVKTISEATAEQKYVYRSEAFQFTSEDKLAGSVMKEIARTFEATRALVQALPWGIDPKPPADLGYYQAKFYVDRASYIAAGGPANSGGVYFSKDRIFRVPFPSLGLQMRGKTWFKDEKYRNDTITHEITHQMMHDFLPFMPTWAIEGTAEYTKMLPYNAGTFRVDAHEHGIKEYIKKAEEDKLTPASIGSVMDHLKMTAEEWHRRADGGSALTGGGSSADQHKLYFASCLMVYYFCHLDGDGKGTRFVRYMDKMREARDAWNAFFKDPRVVVQPDGSFSYPSDLPLPAQQREDAYGIEQLPVLLDGRDAGQLQKAVEEGYKKIGIRW